jgi:parallel beta-helix repeat protein
MQTNLRMFVIGGFVIACQSRESFSPDEIGIVPDHAETSMEAGANPFADAAAGAGPSAGGGSGYDSSSAERQMIEGSVDPGAGTMEQPGEAGEPPSCSDEGGEVESAIYVATSGSDTADGSESNPLRTIARAATLVTPGSTVLVSGGTYVEENVSPATSGSRDAPIAFRPRPGTGDVVIRSASTAISDAPIAVFALSGVSFISIEGFLFDGYEFGKAAIAIEGGGDNVVLNNRFTNLGNADVVPYNANSVVWIANSARNVVRSNLFQDIIGDGVSLNGQQARNNEVVENTFIRFVGKLRSWGGTNLFSRAIDVQDTTEGQNVVAFNYGRELLNHIWLDRDGSRNVILRNVAHDSRGLVFNESRCAFNWIQENIGYDVNIAYQTARYATTGFTFDTRWINNVVFNSSVGFYVHMSERDELRNNIAFNNRDYNIVFTALAESGSPHVFENNLWYTEGKENSIQLGDVAVSVPQFQSSVGESGGLSTDPLFANTSAGAQDFALQEVSPARNAGSGGVDLGAFAVYPATVAGYNPALEPAQRRVSFESVISGAVRGERVELVLRLSRAAASPIAVEVVPIAGDARSGEDFTMEGATVTFEPGETTQTLDILTTGSSEHAELVAFGLRPSCAQPGARNIALLQILVP